MSIWILTKKALLPRDDFCIEISKDSFWIFAIKTMNIVEIKNLSKKFGNITAVDGISLAVEEWKVFAFSNKPNAENSCDYRAG